FYFLAEDGIRDFHVTGVQTCALPIYCKHYWYCRIVYKDLYLYFLVDVGSLGDTTCPLRPINELRLENINSVSHFKHSSYCGGVIIKSLKNRNYVYSKYILIR